MHIERVLIHDKNFDGTAIKAALQLMIEFAAEDEAIRDCVLLIPDKTKLDHSVLSAVLGEHDSGLLRNDEVITIASCSLRLETASSFSQATTGDVILIVYADENLMDAVELNNSFKVIISVPEIESEVSDWQTKWQPISET